MTRIAVYMPNWIGDAVMATPALRAVRTEFPRAQITAVLRPYVSDVLDGLHLIDKQVIWNPKSHNPAQRGWRLASALRREDYDIALLLPNSLRAAWMAFLSGAKMRLGFSRDWRTWLLTDAVTPKPKTEPHPVIDEYLRLVAALGCRRLSREMELATRAGDELRLKNFWQRNSGRLPTEMRGAHPYVCLNPGGAFGSAKHWPNESFGQLAQRIAVEHGRVVLVVCGPAERDSAQRIVRYADHPLVVSVADEPLSVGLTKAAVKHAELLVTTDSGPRHFAQPFGIPVVTLFGPTHIAWSETYYNRAVHLQEDVDCGPCQKRVCPLKHHRCMKDLSVDRVMSVVGSILTERRDAGPSRKSA